MTHRINTYLVWQNAIFDKLSTCISIVELREYVCVTVQELPSVENVYLDHGYINSNKRTFYKVNKRKLDLIQQLPANISDYESNENLHLWDFKNWNSELGMVYLETKEDISAIQLKILDNTFHFIANWCARFEQKTSPEESNELDEALEQLTEQISKTKHYQNQSEILLSETYHRVQNNLQVILSMIKMYVRSGVNDKIAIQQITGKIQLLSNIHLGILVSLEANQMHLTNFCRSLQQDIKQHTGIDHLLISNDSSLIGISFEKSIALGLLMNELALFALSNGINSLAVLLQDATESNSLNVCCQFPPEPSVASSIQQESIQTELIDAFISQLDGTSNFNNQSNTFTINLEV